MSGWAGKTIGPYRLGAAFGTDRRGTVYRATDETIGAAVAVRIVAPPTPDDRWFADRVASALRRYVGITGPHLAPLLAVGESDGRAYVVGPLPDAESLRARLGAPLPRGEVVALLRPIGDALDALHRRYLVHGDLRPETIRFGPDGPLLIDAGLGLAIDDAARLSSGVPAVPPDDEAAYRAPELRSGGTGDPRADIHSLGAIAYEALTGRAPTVANPDPAATSGAIGRALSPSPYTRPANAAEFLAALEAEGAGAEMGAPRALAPVPPVGTSGPFMPARPTPAPPVSNTRPASPPTTYAPPPRPAVPSASAVGGAYTYSSPADFVVASPGEAARQLLAGRAALVDTLAAVARRRAAPLVTERRELVGALRSVAATKAGTAVAPRPATDFARRTAPIAPASRQRDEWREVYSIPSGEAGASLGKGFGWLIVGVLVGAILTGSFSLFLVLVTLGGLGFLFVWRAMTERLIICNPNGFVVEAGFFPWWRSAQFSTWTEVRELRYFETSAGKPIPPDEPTTGTIVSHFAVVTPAGQVFDQADAYSGYDFAGLIDRFNRQTPHLDYLWLPFGEVGNRSVLARAGRYSRVARRRG